MIVQVDPEASAANLGLKLALMQESGELCDFTIVVSGSEIKAHKCVLAASCEYFKTSFSFSDHSQSVTEADFTHNFTHMGADVRTVDSVIRSFYTNEIELDPSHLESILLIADYLMYDRLRNCIEMYMDGTLSFSTAMLYFRLALQYKFKKTSLITSTRWFLAYRFHDYFIYQQETLESNTDMLTAFSAYNIFRHCSPMQMVEFMLKNVKIAIEKLHSFALESHTDVSKEVNTRIVFTFRKLGDVFMIIKPEIMESWKPRLLRFLKTWRRSNLSIGGKEVTELFWCVQSLEFQLSDDNFEIECFCSRNSTYHTCYEKLLTCSYYKKTQICPVSSSVVVCENPKCEHFIPAPNVDAQQSGATSSENVKGSLLRLRQCVCTPNILTQLFPNLEKNDPESQMNPVADAKHTTKAVGHRSQADIEVHDLPGSQAAVSQDIAEDLLPSHGKYKKLPSLSGSFQDRECKILVVLVPTADMAAQLLETDEDTDRELVRTPKLELAYYDIELGTWCRGCQLDFLIPGAMVEKHSWRFAFLNNILYMFSLGLDTGLHYNTVTKTWVHMDCHNIFSAHVPSPHIYSPYSVPSPVKSVIPFKVGRKLIVLSMSRESLSDGTFLTQQHYFEMRDDCETFFKVASIKGDQTDMPITQCTVSDDMLVTVKSSSMVNGTLSHIQRIHLYNSETRVVRSFEAVCTMEAGVKILVKDQVLYILNRDGWCRVYNFRTSSWGEMRRYKSLENLTVWKHGCEPTYPALTHVSCHDGGSRWEVLSYQEKIHSSMLELTLSDAGNIKLIVHASPPFQFMTALCPSTMSRTQLDAMEQRRFAQVDRVPLDFTFSDKI